MSTKSQIGKGRTEVELMGPLNGEVALPAKVNTDEVDVKFSGTNQVNSAGAKIWIQWIHGLKAKMFVLENVPSSFARLASTISDFLPKKLRVKSISVPYCCPKCEHYWDLLIELDEASTRARSEQDFCDDLSFRICPKCGAQGEIDTVPEYYVCLKPK